MCTTFPGTTIEALKIEKGSSRSLFDGIFAADGITLSQLSVMTGLEPYLIQNWVKRGFVSSPVRRLYSREQFARIVIINMLREALQIDHICGLLKVIGGESEESYDDLIGDDELYHRYVDMLSFSGIDIADESSVMAAAESAAEDFAVGQHSRGTKKQLCRILAVMYYAHAASRLRTSAERMLASLL